MPPENRQFGQPPTRRVNVSVPPRCGRTPTANAAPRLSLWSAGVPSLCDLAVARPQLGATLGKRLPSGDSCARYRVGSRRPRRRHVRLPDSPGPLRQPWKRLRLRRSVFHLAPRFGFGLLTSNSAGDFFSPPC